MNRKIAAALALAASTAVLSSHAQSIARENFYAGVSAAQSQLRDCGLPGCDDQGTAWRLFGGYQINRHFSAELGYHDFGKTGFAGGDIKSNAWELVGVGSWPITEQFSLYGKLGGYRGETKASGLFANKGRNTDVTYGAGVQYDVNRNVGLRAEWQRYPKLGGPDLGGERDVDVFGVAVLWRFR
jgi:OOP family OmpA-OmpF porin